LLILEIFAQRARSHEGKLQVELARLQYMSTRLVRRWSHLERQTGGAGVRGGPGEKQIELDKRMIGDAIKRTKERLAKVKKQRQTQRKQRERRNSFTISLVGYTNAGKSTLFNARQLYLGDAARSVSLSDTVGFIRDLPHGLIDAFAATLQEAADADLLLHVVDGANPDYLEQIEQVQRVLSEIGAADVPQILVFNKLDAIEKDNLPLQLQDMFELRNAFESSSRSAERVFVSARTGEGLPLLRALLASYAAHPPADEIPLVAEDLA
jgi:GTP-binding protein HflX